MKIVIRGSEMIYGSEIGTLGENERCTTEEMVTTVVQSLVGGCQIINQSRMIND